MLQLIQEAILFSDIVKQLQFPKLNEKHLKKKNHCELKIEVVDMLEPWEKRLLLKYSLQFPGLKESALKSNVKSPFIFYFMYLNRGSWRMELP